jgi:hypothetical protein
MLTVVLLFNLLIAGFCWYLVWRVWRLRQTLAQIADALTVAEHYTRTMQETPAAVLQGHSKIIQLRRQYQQVLIRVQQVQQIIMLLQLGQVWWRSTKKPPNGSTARSPHQLYSYSSNHFFGE